MKKCSFCDHSCRTERGELVCAKRLLYVEDLEEYPCSDFSVRFELKETLIVLGVCIVALFALALILS